jgi:hypothetical protein
MIKFPVVVLTDIALNFPVEPSGFLNWLTANLTELDALAPPVNVNVAERMFVVWVHVMVRMLDTTLHYTGTAASNLNS